MYLSKNTILVACLMLTPALISSTEGANKKDPKNVSATQKSPSEAELKAAALKADLLKIKQDITEADKVAAALKADLEKAQKDLEKVKAENANTPSADLQFVKDLETIVNDVKAKSTHASKIVEDTKAKYTKAKEDAYGKFSCFYVKIKKQANDAYESSKDKPGLWLAVGAASASAVLGLLYYKFFSKKNNVEKTSARLDSIYGKRN